MLKNKTAEAKTWKSELLSWGSMYSATKITEHTFFKTPTKNAEIGTLDLEILYFECIPNALYHQLEVSCNITPVSLKTKVLQSLPFAFVLIYLS